MKTYLLYLMMNPVRELFTNKIVGFEKLLVSRRTESLDVWSGKVLIYLRKNEAVIPIGDIISADKEYQTIHNQLWRQYTISLKPEIKQEEILAYFNTENGPFQNLSLIHI